MTEITELTTEQEKQIAEYRKRYWEQAISTEPVDRNRAEEAIETLAKTGNIKVDKIIWVTSPDAGKNAYNTAWNLFKTSVGTQLTYSFESPFWTSFETSFKTYFWTAVRASLRPSLSNLLCSSLWISFESSLRASLWNSFMIPFDTSLKNILWRLLLDSFRDSITDLASLMYYNYAVDVLGINVDDSDKKLLALNNEVAASCFAAWIAPKTIILCERPKTVKIEGGKLVELTWRK